MTTFRKMCISDPHYVGKMCINDVGKLRKMCYAIFGYSEGRDLLETKRDSRVDKMEIQ